MVIIVNKDELEDTSYTGLKPLMNSPMKGGRLNKGVMAVVDNDSLLRVVCKGTGIEINDEMYVVRGISTPMLTGVGTSENFKQLVVAVIVEKDIQ